ncbi:MAG: hypothetical protein JO090_13720 [Rhizobacter sp.]|nr:hypothetical protein [Rhizobacter sp.]
MAPITRKAWHGRCAAAGTRATLQRLVSDAPPLKARHVAASVARLRLSSPHPGSALPRRRVVAAAPVRGDAAARPDRRPRERRLA